jgi:hypothetical protein
MARWLRNSTDRNGGRKLRIPIKSRQNNDGNTTPDKEPSNTEGRKKSLTEIRNFKPNCPPTSKTQNSDSTKNAHSDIIDSDLFCDRRLIANSLVSPSPRNVEPPPPFKSKPELLAEWSIINNISHVALRQLLILLKDWCPNSGFPTDPRTLLRTPRSVKTIKIAGGEFFHFGILKHIISCINEGLGHYSFSGSSSLNNLENLISLKIGIDGLPISKSSNLQFWPILGSIDQAKLKKAFIISLFYGETKPNSIEEYLRAFVNEMHDLETNGLSYGGTMYVVRINTLIADAPARSFVKCVKNHNAYFGCERCHRKGKWAKRVIYPKNKIGELYDDESFLEQIFSSHHEGVSPLTELRLGMISQIPLDYMHLICLGIMKKMLLTWISGTLSVRLGPKQIAELSRRMIIFKYCIPCNFNRKCRTLKDIKHWKATEFRTFLLYVGPSVLRKVLNASMFNHFMLFHSSIYILANSSDNEWVNYAGQLLSRFVQETPLIYFKEMIVYNMHSLLHLHEDVLRHGPLDEFSAFEFDNSMQGLQKLIRMNRSHLSQVVRRIIELDSNPVEKIPRMSDKSISAKKGDNCFITNDLSICVVSKVLCHGTYECFKFNNKRIVTYYPFPSEKLFIFKVNNPSNPMVIKFNQVLKKCMLLPVNEKFICIPLISG